MTVVLAVVAAVVAIWIVMCVVALWWVARHNRVAAGAHTGAPLHWIAAPSRAAGAHRRLRRAVVAARAGLDAGPSDGTAHAELATCVDALERQAVDLDRRLVVAARCPPATRWKLVGDLDPQIKEVERLGGRLAEIAVVAAGPIAGAGEGMAALDVRLAALAEARHELDVLDAGGSTTSGTPAPGSTGGPTASSVAAPAATGGPSEPADTRALPSPGLSGIVVPTGTPASQPARRRDG